MSAGMTYLGGELIREQIYEFLINHYICVLEITKTE